MLLPTREGSLKLSWVLLWLSRGSGASVTISVALREPPASQRRGEALPAFAVKLEGVFFGPVQRCFEAGGELQGDRSHTTVPIPLLPWRVPLVGHDVRLPGEDVHQVSAL